MNTTATVIDTNTFPESLLDTTSVNSPTTQIPISHHLSNSSSTTSTPSPTAHPPPLHSPARKQPPPSSSPRYSPTRLPLPPAITPTRAPSPLTPSLRLTLPHLAAQPPFYATIHIHGKPYLITAGDTIRLPFLMHGVLPGDILRLNRAIVLGSRDWTLLGGDNTISTSTSTSTVPDADIIPPLAEPIIGLTDGLISTNSTATTKPTQKKSQAPKYLDDRLFTCRALVLGTESEPMRIKEKTKQRQRRVKKVKSKHRYTILKIRELVVRGVEEIEAGDDQGLGVDTAAAAAEI